MQRSNLSATEANHLYLLPLQFLLVVQRIVLVHGVRGSVVVVVVSEGVLGLEGLPLGFSPGLEELRRLLGQRLVLQQGLQVGLKVVRGKLAWVAPYGTSL